MALVSEIIESLNNNPDDWVAGSHYLQHKKSGLAIWIANGKSFLRVDNPRIRFTWRAKRKLWKAIRTWYTNLSLDRLAERN